MKFNQLAAVIVVIIVSFICIVGCTTNPITQIDKSAAKLVWPKAPQIPRIQYLYSFNSAKDLHITRGFIKTVLDFITGDSSQKNIAQPYGITKDEQGRLYIVDTFHKIIHVFDEKKSVPLIWLLILSHHLIIPPNVCLCFS